MVSMQGIDLPSPVLVESLTPSRPRLPHALVVAINACSLLSNKLELIGISGVWNGFFMTASASVCVSPPQ